MEKSVLLNSDVAVQARKMANILDAQLRSPIEKIHDMVLAHRRLKVMKDIVAAIGISHVSVVPILNGHLGMRKLSARWVPRLLTIDHNRNRVTISQERLALFNRNMNELVRRFVTVDGTRIHYNTQETKQQSKQWVSRGESAPNKAKVGLSANKAMATVCWGACGIILIDYLQKGKTINGEYYSNLLGRFVEALKKK